jgi:thiamine-phosphate pyrophosphorylase
MDDTLLKQARQLNLRNGGQDARLPPIVLMTDDVQMPDPVKAIRNLPRDSMVIYRHYDHPDRARLGAQLRQICRARHIAFLVADDLSLALKLNADGVHLPEYRILTKSAIYQRIPDWMIRTSACHGPDTIRRLALLPSALRPDGVLISPLFATDSHPGSASLATRPAFAMIEMCRRAGMQAIGLGGITAKTAKKLKSSSIASLAGIGFAVS